MKHAQLLAALAEKPPGILIVDDTRINRELLRLRLAKHGYQFFMAENGRQATEVLQVHPEVDLILLDLMMPEMDGFDFLEWRAGRPEIQAIPVIVNSSLDDFDSIAKALTMDSYDYFTKPLTQSDLEMVLPLKIRNAVVASRLMQETRRQNEHMRRELKMAARYQKFLLPRETRIKGVRVAYLFEPCSGVGGDFFDCLELDKDRMAIMVADVSGHGVASAMTASIVKALLPGFLRQSGSPAQALTQLNDDLLRLTPDDVFVTAFAAIFDRRQGQLIWSLAGHPPPLYLSGEDDLKLLAAESFFLGSFDSDSGYLDLDDQVLPTRKGDRLVIYTDGLTEAPDARGNQFGISRLQRLMNDSREQGPEQARDRLWQELQRFVPGEFPDDVAFILVDFDDGR